MLLYLIQDTFSFICDTQIGLSQSITTGRVCGIVCFINTIILDISFNYIMSDGYHATFYSVIASTSTFLSEVSISYVYVWQQRFVNTSTNENPLTKLSYMYLYIQSNFNIQQRMLILAKLLPEISICV